MQGLVICLLSSAGQPVRAIIAVNMRGACLELSRMDGNKQRAHVASLQEALNKLPELAATHTQCKPGQTLPVYSLHAGSGSLFTAQADFTKAPRQNAPHAQRPQMQQRSCSPLRRVLHRSPVRSNRIMPLDSGDTMQNVSALADQALPSGAPGTGLGVQSQNASSTEVSQAAQDGFGSPPPVLRTSVSPPLPCTSPFAKAAEAVERNHIQRALQLMGVAKGPSQLWQGLRQLRADRERAEQGWADAWISHDALEVSPDTVTLCWASR